MDGSKNLDSRFNGIIFLSRWALYPKIHFFKMPDHCTLTRKYDKKLPCRWI